MKTQSLAVSGVAGWSLAFALIASLLTGGPVAAAESRLIHGDAVTGTNRYLGEPVRDFGGVLGTAGFYNVNAYVPGGTDSEPLTPDTDFSRLLASGVDPGFLALLGLTPEAVNPDLVNRPLRETPVNVDPAGATRVPLPGLRDADGRLAAAQAEPADAITLESWLRATGTALIRCSGAAPTVSLRLAGLIPNRVYTVWAIFGGEGLIPRPLGGVPNVVVSDGSGAAGFDRELNFCPLEATPGEAPLMLIDVVFHSDHQVYGDVPDLPFNGLFTGLVTHTQLEFAMTGERIR